MWLKQGVADELLTEGNITREELAREFDCTLTELNLVLDGKMESGPDLAFLLVMAFGFDVIERVTDWDKTEGD